MNEVVDLAQYDREPDERRKRRERTENERREWLRQKINHMHDDAEDAFKYARDLIRIKADVSNEFKDMEAYAASLLLVIAMLKREIEHG